MTNDGPASGSACEFPFNYMDVSHTGCTTIDGDTRPWCITQTTANGDMAASGAWGYCGASCPVEGILIWRHLLLRKKGPIWDFQRRQLTALSPPLDLAQGNNFSINLGHFHQLKTTAA